MNARYLASTGGRIAHAALSLSFALGAYAALASPGPTATRWIGVGLVAVIVGFVLAAVLSVREFFAYTLGILFFVPLAASCLIMGIGVGAGTGAVVGLPVAVVGAIVFVSGIVLGLGAVSSPDTAATSDLGDAAQAASHQ